MTSAHWLAVLLVSTLVAGCVGPEEGPETSTEDKDAATGRFELPRMGVTITNGDGDPTHRIMADGEQKFVFHPVLHDGDLSDLDAFGLANFDGEYGFRILDPLLVDGALQPHEWVADAARDDRCTEPDKIESSRTGSDAGSHAVYWQAYNNTYNVEESRAVARIAIDETFPPCTYDFAESPVPVLDRRCTDTRNLSEGLRWYWMPLNGIPLRVAADVPMYYLNELDAANSTVRVVVHLDGDAELLMCRSEGSQSDMPAEATREQFVQRDDGAWMVTFDESEFYGGLTQSYQIHIFNNLPAQQVTVSGEVHYPATPPL